MRTISGLLVLSGVAIGFGSLAPQAATSRNDVDLPHGAALYATYCKRCHGSHGDDISCSGDMTPLAGMCKRPRFGLVAKVTSPAYFARGGYFQGEDARDLTAFLCSLKGEKGFDAPEFLCLPRLLNKHCGSLKYYRVIDVREKGAYDKAHVSNAVLWPVPLSTESPSAGSEAAVRSTLGLFGVGPETMVVIYDEVVSTRASLIWWSLMRAGHRKAAILDGGMRRWNEDGYFVTPALTPMTPAEYGAVLPTTPRFTAVDTAYPVLRIDTGSPKASPGIFSPELTLTQGSLRTATEIRSYLEKCGIRSTGTYRLEGDTSGAPYLVFLLRLLGFSEAEFDPGSNLLQSAAHP